MQRSGAVSQRFPSVPDGQAQKKSPSKLMQLALFRHGLFAPLSGPSCFFFKNQIEYKEADQKSNKLLPGGQVHLKLLISSVKVPPLRQGETGAHSLILTLGVLLVQHVLLQDDRQFIGCAGLAQCVAGYTQV